MIAIMMAAVACKQGEKAPEPAPKPGNQEVPAATRAEPSEVDTRAEVLAALDAWVVAQRQGNVDAYLAYYHATDFTGVRRTKDGKTVELDAAGWKTDRKGMFASGGMEVAVAEPEVKALGGGEIEVRFVQRFQRDEYSDHGEKVIRFRRDDAGKLWIVREEMVTSKPGWSEAAEGVDLRPFGIAARIDLPAGADASMFDHNEYGKVASIYNQDQQYSFMVRPQTGLGDLAARQQQEKDANAESESVGDDGSSVEHEQKTAHGWEFGVSWPDHASCNDPGAKCVDCYHVEVWREDLGVMCESDDSCPTKKQYQATLDACRTLAP